MAIPSTNIELANDIYGEANGGYTTGEASLRDLSFFSYFAGPNGSNSLSYNAWGVSENTGNNRIYGTTYHPASSGRFDYEMSEYANLVYFYDNSTYQVTLDVVNNLVSTPPPPFPIDNDVNVNIELWDDGFTYQYMAGGGMAGAPGTYGPSSVSQTNDPIIFRGYWKVVISGAFPSFAGGNADLTINGTSFFTGQAVAAGAGGTTFTSSTWGTADVASYGGYIGLYFEVEIN
jgi:hypothetical protein